MMSGPGKSGESGGTVVERGPTCPSTPVPPEQGDEIGPCITMASDPASAVLAWLMTPASASSFRRWPTYWVDPSTMNERGEAGSPEGPRLPGGQMTASDGSVSSVEACRSTLWMSTVAYRMAVAGVECR